MGVIEDRRRIIEAQPHLVTASGSSVLVTIAEPKIERLKVSFLPVQTGSGTPSPSNVRPISGWSTIGVQFGVGKNLWDEEYENIDTSGNTVKYRAVYVGADPVTFSTTCPANSNGYTVLYALPGAVSAGGDSANNGFKSGSPRTVTPANGYVTIGYRCSGSVDPRNYGTQIEYGTTATAYEPHTGKTVLSPLGGTYYGGTVDLVSGVMTVTKQGYLGSDLTSISVNSTSSSVTVFSFSLDSNGLPRGVNATVISNRFSRDIPSGTAGRIVQTDAMCWFVVATSELSEVSEAGGKAWLSQHSSVFVYDLATPQTVTLTPQTIAALRGQQTVTSPAGAVEISYWTH